MTQRNVVFVLIIKYIKHTNIKEDFTKTSLLRRYISRSRIFTMFEGGTVVTVFVFGGRPKSWPLSGTTVGRTLPPHVSFTGWKWVVVTPIGTSPDKDGQKRTVEPSIVGTKLVLRILITSSSDSGSLLNRSLIVRHLFHGYCQGSSLFMINTHTFVDI